MDGRDVGVSDGCNDPSGKILGNDHGSALDDGAPVGTSDPTEGPRETLGEPDGVVRVDDDIGVRCACELPSINDKSLRLVVGTEMGALV